MRAHLRSPSSGCGQRTRRAGGNAAPPWPRTPFASSSQTAIRSSSSAVARGPSARPSTPRYGFAACCLSSQSPVEALPAGLARSRNPPPLSFSRSGRRTDRPEARSAGVRRDRWCQRAGRFDLASGGWKRFPATASRSPRVLPLPQGTGVQFPARENLARVLEAMRDAFHRLRAPHRRSDQRCERRRDRRRETYRRLWVSRGLQRYGRRPRAARNETPRGQGRRDALLEPRTPYPSRHGRPDAT